MTGLAATIPQVEVDRLPSLHSSLTQALNEAGLNEAGCDEENLREIFSNHVVAECVMCGTRITGEEMAGFTSGEEKSVAPDSRFDRLKRGLCAKKGCVASHYRVHLREHPQLNWMEIRKKAGEADAVKETEAIRKKRLIRVGLGIGVILILLLCRYIMYYGHVPLRQKPHNYTIDPASVP